MNSINRYIPTPTSVVRLGCKLSVMVVACLVVATWAPTVADAQPMFEQFNQETSAPHVKSYSVSDCNNLQAIYGKLVADYGEQISVQFSKNVALGRKTLQWLCEVDSLQGKSSAVQSVKHQLHSRYIYRLTKNLNGEVMWFQTENGIQREPTLDEVVIADMTEDQKNVADDNMIRIGSLSPVTYTLLCEEKVQLIRAKKLLDIKLDATNRAFKTVKVACEYSADEEIATEVQKQISDILRQRVDQIDESGQYPETGRDMCRYYSIRDDSLNSEQRRIVELVGPWMKKDFKDRGVGALLDLEQLRKKSIL